MLGVYPDVSFPDGAVRVVVAQGGFEGGLHVFGCGEYALDGGEFVDWGRVGGEYYGCCEVGGDGVDVGGGGKGAEGVSREG